MTGASFGSSDRTSGSRRAVSDLLGFAVVFSLVVLSVALLYTVGIGALSELQHAEAMNNAGRAFDVFAANMEDVHRHGAPARSTEFNVAGGEMAATGQVSLTVSNASLNLSETFVTTPVTYQRRETEFHYVGGAVVRSDRDSHAVVNEPFHRFGPDRTVISFVSTVPAGGTTSAGGTGTVHLSARRVGSPTATEVSAAPGQPVTANVSITSPRWGAWDRYLDRQGLTRLAADPANATVVYRLETDVIYFRHTLARVRMTA